MKLDRFLLFASAFLALFIACHALYDDRSATAEEHYTEDENWSKAIEEHTLEAKRYTLDAIAYHQKNDVGNAIENYKRAAKVNNQIAEIARNANLLTQAIEAYKQKARLHKKGAQLCRQASNIKEEASLHALAATAYKKMAEIYAMIAANYRHDNDPIGEASAWLMAAKAYRKSANSFGNANNTDRENSMYTVASRVCIMAANIFQATKSFNQEAEARMQAAGAYTLSAWACRQMDDALKGAEMYTIAVSDYMDAVKAYKNANNHDGIIEAYQQAVTWRTITAQIYHDARDYWREARHYIEIAHLHLDKNEHALAGRAFELAGQAYLHAQDLRAAVARFQEAEKAYAAASDATAVQRVQRAVMACDLTTRELYHRAARRLRVRRTMLTGQVGLYIRRSDLLLDSYNAVMALESTKASSTRYKIVFVGEMGDDRGGLSREWFSLLAKEIVCPPHAFFISRNPQDQTYQPNPTKNSPEDLNHYHFFGRVLAMAINSDNLVHFRLTDGFLKHLLGQPVVFEDLRTFDPTLYHSYDALKRMQDLSGMDLFFSVHTNDGIVELCPNGNNRPVTLDNRDEYIGLVTHYYLTTQIRPQLIAFLSGFHSFVHRDCIASLNTRALTWLISGESTLSVDDWEHHTLYEDCSATSMPVIWFWNTVRSFSAEQRAKLLHFATGSSLVPLGGFSMLDPTFTIAKINQGEDHAPSAATCFRKLNLPNYSSEALLRGKLLYAIEEGHVSFGFV